MGGCGGKGLAYRDSSRNEKVTLPFFLPVTVVFLQVLGENPLTQKKKLYRFELSLLSAGVIAVTLLFLPIHFMAE